MLCLSSKRRNNLMKLFKCFLHKYNFKSSLLIEIETQAIYCKFRLTSLLEKHTFNETSVQYMRLSLMSKSRAVASLTPDSGITMSLWLVSSEIRLMSIRRVNSKKASGTMQVFPSWVSSRPMGQAHTNCCGYGRLRHK